MGRAQTKAGTIAYVVSVELKATEVAELEQRYTARSWRRLLQDPVVEIDNKVP